MNSAADRHLYFSAPSCIHKILRSFVTIRIKHIYISNPGGYVYIGDFRVPLHPVIFPIKHRLYSEIDPVPFLYIYGFHPHWRMSGVIIGFNCIRPYLTPIVLNCNPHTVRCFVILTVTILRGEINKCYRCSYLYPSIKGSFPAAHSIHERGGINPFFVNILEICHHSIGLHSISRSYRGRGTAAVCIKSRNSSIKTVEVNYSVLYQIGETVTINITEIGAACCKCFTGIGHEIG
ncbi:hypothetical protein ES703_24580 [subsurface metagenome]